MAARSIIGMDIGGTKSAIALYEEKTGALIREERFPTNAAAGFPAVMEEAVGAITRMREKGTIGVGVGIPGLIEQPEGVVHGTPNIPGGEHFRAREFLEERLKLPVAVENDARCFTLAEALYGAAKGHGIVIGITMGTGVGGGIVVNGKIFHGAHGFAGEIGHMLLRPGEPPYPTDDARGEAEQFLSGTAMGRRCEAAKRPEEYLDGEVCSFLRPEVFREVAWLATSLTHLLDPSIIVLGGSTGRALKPHLKAIETELMRWMLPGTPLPELAIAKRSDAGTLGAALLSGGA